MIYEIAEIDVLGGTERQFEAAVAGATPYFQGAAGCLSLKLHRSIEFPCRYRLVVAWESVQDHTTQFRESQAFARWRELASPHFAAPPRVEHVTTLDVGF